MHAYNDEVNAKINAAYQQDYLQDQAAQQCGKVKGAHDGCAVRSPTQREQADDGCAVRSPTQREQAEKNVGFHREQADKADRAAAFFRENPAFDEFIQLIRSGVIGL
jgi:hypothetical protein